jgi:hypothetical protein
MKGRRDELFAAVHQYRSAGFGAGSLENRHKQKWLSINVQRRLGMSWSIPM